MICLVLMFVAAYVASDFGLSLEAVADGGLASLTASASAAAIWCSHWLYSGVFAACRMSCARMGCASSAAVRVAATRWRIGCAVDAFEVPCPPL